MPNTLSFLTYVMLTTFTPGPNNIMALCNAGKLGFRRSLPFNLGVAAGFVTVLLLSCAFSFALYKVLPSIKIVMDIVGAAYMLFLAYRTLRPKSHAGTEEKTYTTFLAGALLQFVNPKGILYGITVASVYITPYYTSPFVLAGFAVFLSLVALASTCSWSAFGSAFQRFIVKHQLVFNMIMAMLLVYCAVSLFL